MSPAQVREASRLLSALDGIDSVVEVATRYAERTDTFLRISVYEGDEDGGSTWADVCLPLNMLPLVAPELRGAVTARLQHMGVKLPQEERSSNG